MARKEFSREISERVLIRCRRHCCVCDKFCGTKIEIHHIEGNDDNSETNALPVCFDCHAEIIQYSCSHPRGRKFRPSELKKLREATFRKYSEDRLFFAETNSMSEYGKGFHEGMILAEKRINTELVWKFISSNGDFAIEILVMFNDDNTCAMTDETLYDDEVNTGTSINQSKGHHNAWYAGLELGLWSVDPEREVLFLTQRGKFFRDLVRNTPQLNQRCHDLKKFWDMPYWKRPKNKPGSKPHLRDFEPGWLGWLQIELFSPVIVEGLSQLFILISANKAEVVLKNIDIEETLIFSPESISDLDLDHEKGFLKLKIKEDY